MWCILCGCYREERYLARDGGGNQFIRRSHREKSAGEIMQIKASEGQRDKEQRIICCKVCEFFLYLPFYFSNESFVLANNRLVVLIEKVVSRDTTFLRVFFSKEFPSIKCSPSQRFIMYIRMG